MLDLRHVIDHLDEVRAGLARRGKVDLALDVVSQRAGERRDVIVELESLRAKRNEVSASLAKVDKKSAEFTTQREAMRTVGDRIKELEARHREIESEIEQALLVIPNIPHASVPDGQGSEDNPVVRVWGDKPTYAFTPKDHVDLGTSLGIVDFDRGAKISGARFTVLRGAGAALERALMMFMLDTHVREHGYTEIWPPVLINRQSMTGTGQLPKFEGDAFKIDKSWDVHGENKQDLFLAPTAEVPVTNLHADEILEQLPIAYTAYTACFRSEAGSYGKDTRGLIRQHQFDKVELVRFCRPEDGPAQLELLTSHAEKILQKLGLHYRVVALCAGDLGGASQKTYDLEVWLPGMDAYREISSCSWFGDYQARRAKIRHRPAKGEKPELAHTLNGSGLAIGRTLVAILEQCQQADGSIRIPHELVKYTGFEIIQR
jgi:seryl-tRNA synthetase